MGNAPFVWGNGDNAGFKWSLRCQERSCSNACINADGHWGLFTLLNLGRTTLGSWGPHRWGPNLCQDCRCLHNLFPRRKTFLSTHSQWWEKKHLKVLQGDQNTSTLPTYSKVDRLFPLEALKGAHHQKKCGSPWQKHLQLCHYLDAWIRQDLGYLSRNETECHALG